MIRPPPRSTQSRSSAASDVYKRQVPERSDDVTIRDSDIGWTTADDSGNTGFGIRVYHGARLRIERNYIHHIAGDAIQFGMDDPDVDAIVDRNEVSDEREAEGVGLEVVLE